MTRKYRAFILALALPALCQLVCLTALMSRAAAGQQTVGNDKAYQHPGSKEQQAADEAYFALIKESEAMPDDFDFVKFRAAFARSSYHLPDDFPGVAEMIGLAMSDAAGDPKRLPLADNVTKIYAGDVSLYVTCLRTAEMHGIEGMNMPYHQWMLGGILRTVMESGDGKRPESAFHVLGEMEEYFIARTKLRLKVLEKTTLPYKGRVYDVLTVSNPENGEEGHIYFTTDLDMPTAGTATEKR